MKGKDLPVPTIVDTIDMKDIENKTKVFEDLAEKIRLAKEGDAALNAILLEQYKNLLQVGTMVWQSVLTAEEAYRLKVAELNNLLAENVISHETYARAVIQSHERMILSSDKLINKILAGIQNWSTTWSGMMTNMLFTGEGTFGEVL